MGGYYTQDEYLDTTWNMLAPYINENTIMLLIILVVMMFFQTIHFCARKLII